MLLSNALLKTLKYDHVVEITSLLCTCFYIYTSQAGFIWWDGMTGRDLRIPDDIITLPLYGEKVVPHPMFWEMYYNYQASLTCYLHTGRGQRQCKGFPGPFIWLGSTKWTLSILIRINSISLIVDVVNLNSNNSHCNTKNFLISQKLSKFSEFPTGCGTVKEHKWCQDITFDTCSLICIRL